MDYRKAVETLSKVITKAIDEKASRLAYDRTFLSIVQGDGRRGRYKIVKDNQIYEVPSAVEGKLTYGQQVWVTIPGGVFRKMYISGKRQAERN